ncbi:hypothetical protein [Oxalobacter paraformigenes]|uniref:hypothetical protein n=1 Tax=Oxalobacter paraformigenes TaxID=556268 RepID=UPI000593689A|nr:hypothetical protein [Oxalobacter paraformigenes]
MPQSLWQSGFRRVFADCREGGGGNPQGLFRRQGDEVAGASACGNIGGRAAVFANGIFRVFGLSRPA